MPITVYTTPTWPWCDRTKEFLRQRGAEYTERDASVDRSAAEDILRLTGQLGVPVTTDGEEVIVGFDAARLQSMAARNRRRGLGLAVADHQDGGALVGKVKPDSPAGRAGVQQGDVVEELSGIPIRSADDLQKVAAKWAGDSPTSLTVSREGERKTIILYG
jgi:glutaredoxin 3